MQFSDIITCMSEGIVTDWCCQSMCDKVCDKVWQKCLPVYQQFFFLVLDGGYAGRVLQGMGPGLNLVTQLKPLPMSTHDVHILGRFP